MKFSERLKEATDVRRVEWGPTALGKFFGVSKQTAERWMGEGQPSIDKIFDIADRLGVDPRWLATGEGPMLPTPASSDLKPHEEDLIARYRTADPRWQLSLRLLSHLATEEQIEAATDVNMVVARIFGMKRKDLRPPTDKYVAQKIGTAPHVAKQKEKAKK